jgi:DNA-binding beta-propeller fold protein YncE
MKAPGSRRGAWAAVGGLALAAVFAGCGPSVVGPGAGGMASGTPATSATGSAATSASGGTSSSTATSSSGGTGGGASCTEDSDCPVGPCDGCPPADRLCLAPLGVGDCKGDPCHPGTVPTCGPVATFGGLSRPAAAAFDGTNMWVVNGGGDRITELGPSGETLGTFAVGTSPEGIAFDGTNMWIADDGSSTVTKLSEAGAVLGTFVVVNGGSFSSTAGSVIAWDGTHVWVTSGGYGTVTVL